MSQTRRRLAAVLFAAAISQLTYAAPTLNIKHVPTNIPPAQLQANLLPILTAQNQRTVTKTQQTRVQINSALNAMEPERKALTAAFANDPRYKTLMSQAQRIAASSPDARTRADQLKKLFSANQVVFDDAARVAKVTPGTLQAKAGGGRLTPGLGIVFAPATPLRTVLSNAATPIPDQVLSPPFNFESTDKDNGGIAIAVAKPTANTDQGSVEMVSGLIGVAGDANGTAIVGETIAVPPGVKRVELTVSATRLYTGSALATLAAATSCTDMVIIVSTVDRGSELAEDDDLQCIAAIVGWYAEMDGNDAGDHHFSVTIPDGVHSLTVSATAYSDSFAAGLLGSSDGYVSGQISQIRAHFLN